MKSLLVLFLLTAPHAGATIFDRYFEHGSTVRQRPARAPACARFMAPLTDANDRLSGELMMSADATQNFLERLRHTLSLSRADGVVITGSRRHRLFGGEMPLELRVITGPRNNVRTLAVTRNRLRKDLVENTTFLSRFGARDFVNEHGVYVTATPLRLTPAEVPSLAQLDGLRARLSKDLAEFEGLMSIGAPLSEGNAFAAAMDPFCRGPEFVFDHVAKFCLPAAFRRIYRGVRGAEDFAAGADTTIIFRNDGSDVSPWTTRLRELGYTNIYSMHTKGVVRLLDDDAIPSGRVNGRRGGRMAGTVPTASPAERARARR